MDYLLSEVTHTSLAAGKRCFEMERIVAFSWRLQKGDITLSKTDDGRSLNTLIQVWKGCHFVARYIPYTISVTLYSSNNKVL